MQNTPLTCADIARWLEILAPPRIAEDYDNVGLLVGEADTPVRGILVSLDITPEVLAEARDIGANLVISHHPIWFRSRKHLRGDDFVSQQILYAIRHGLALYACHTNLDNIRLGVNRAIVDRLGMSGVEFLMPRQPDHPAHDDSFCEAGSGMIGDLPAAVLPRELLSRVRDAFGCECIRYSYGASIDEPNAGIKRVAVCGGAGGFLLETAQARGAQAFITSDITYHRFFETCGAMLLMDMGHYESEQFTGEVIRDYLARQMAQSSRAIDTLQLTTVRTNPVRYFQ